MVIETALQTFFCSRVVVFDLGGALQTGFCVLNDILLPSFAMYTSTSSVAGDVKLACGFVAIAATAILLPSLQAATPTTTLPVQTVVPVTASQSSAALVRSPFRRDPYFNVAAPAAAEGYARMFSQTE